MNLVRALDNALGAGCDWEEVLTNLLMATRWTPSKGGNPRIEMFVKTALEDPVLQRNPLLHSDTLIAKCDISYSSGASSFSSDGSALWDQLEDRREGEDVDTLRKR